MKLSATLLLRHIAPLALLASLIVSGCIYRVPVQQGNFLDDKELDQIKVGMTRTQVRYLLGTPMVADPFESTRWDYVYTFKQGAISRAQRRHFVVYFADDKVVRTERPASPKS
jgi:outer membrane protein assembly factor BamE